MPGAVVQAFVEEMGLLAASLAYRPVLDTTADSVSLGLKQIWSAVKDRDKVHILDLGSPNQSRIDHYRTKCTCQLQVADLSRAVGGLYQESLRRQSARRRRDRGRQPRSAELGALLNLPDGSRFDLVFAWDVVNYLSTAQIQELGDALARCTRRGTILHLLLGTADRMSPDPATTTISTVAEREHLRLIADGAGRVPSPRHPPLTVQRYMPGFRVVHMYQLANGFHEHIYEFAADSAGAEKPPLG